MGAIKENSYTIEETNLFYVARDFAHPARIRIITELLFEKSYRNTDLSKFLQLSKSTIHGHVNMLKDAGIISIVYGMHYYNVELNAQGREWAEFFLSKKRTFY